MVKLNTGFKVDLLLQLAQMEINGITRLRQGFDVASERFADWQRMPDHLTNSFATLSY
jgi:hypothetical protein